jgi:hypothetical protein
MLSTWILELEILETVGNLEGGIPYLSFRTKWMLKLAAMNTAYFYQQILGILIDKSYFL